MLDIPVQFVGILVRKSLATSELLASAIGEKCPRAEQKNDAGATARPRRG
jgi:hypothetical protein